MRGGVWLVFVVLVAVLGFPGTIGEAQEVEETGDNDPTIYPYEIFAETSDWQDGGGNPPYPWYEPPMVVGNESVELVQD